MSSSTSPTDDEPAVPTACCSPSPPVGRRTLLQAASVSGAALGLGLLGGRPASAAGPPAGRPGRRSAGLQVLLLGTQAGPPPVPGRTGISTAVVVDGATYIVDCGRSSVTQYQRAGLLFADLKGIFLTHLHADHVADYYDYFLLAGTTVTGDQVPVGVPVYGPGPAGALPPAAGGAQVPTVDPADPTPGTVAMTESCHAAFAYSSNIFLRGAPRQIRDIRTLVAPHEIALPDVGASPLGQTAPPMAPFPVMEDDRVRVSAVLVPHGSVFPAFAFRFDTDHGSVTLSGDTSYSENVIGLARASDLLVHEAISVPDTGFPQAFVDYQLGLHTLVDRVGEVAQRAGVPRLVLSHVIDFASPAALDAHSWRRRARAGYDGKVTVGEDLMVLEAGRRRTGSGASPAKT